MEKYIALLRGINVGGKNKISMTELKKLFEEITFNDISTYINSGNVIFSSSKSKEEIKKLIESAIKNKLSLNIPVAIITGEELIKSLKNAPAWWDKEKDSKHNAIFVIKPFTAKEVVEQMGISEYEQVSYYNQTIFWSAPLKAFTKTNWSKITEKPFYNSITIRNANTTKKLSELIK